MGCNSHALRCALELNAYHRLHCAYNITIISYQRTSIVRETPRLDLKHRLCTQASQVTRSTRFRADVLTVPLLIHMALNMPVPLTPTLKRESERRSF